MTTLIRPTQLAEMLDVSESTIKRWCLRLSEFLSEYATPSHRSQRRLTEQDVLLLRRVKELLDTGLSLEAIAAQLKEESLKLPADLPAASGVASDARDPWSTLEDALARIAIQEQRSAQLEAGLERLSQEVETLKTGARQ